MDNAQVKDLLPLLKALSEKSPDLIQYRENSMGIQVWATDNRGRKHPFFVDVGGNAVNLTQDFLDAVCDESGMFYWVEPAESKVWTAYPSRGGILVTFPTKLTAATASTIYLIKHHLGIQ